MVRNVITAMGVALLLVLSAVAQEEKETPPEPRGTICNDLKTLTERIECRLSKSHEELLQEEYRPEGCEWGSSEWRDDCRRRYEAISPCYDLVVGNARMGCIKKKLGLPATLLPVKEFCTGKDANCAALYRATIHHLIVARFYDAEERTEDWYEAGKLSLADTRDFIIFTTRQKLAFYSATSKSGRVAILNDVQAAWDTLLTKLSE